MTSYMPSPSVLNFYPKLMQHPSLTATLLNPAQLPPLSQLHRLIKSSRFTKSLRLSHPLILGQALLITVAAHGDDGSRNDAAGYGEYADCDEEEEEYPGECSLVAEGALVVFELVAGLRRGHFDGLGELGSGGLLEPGVGRGEDGLTLCAVVLGGIVWLLEEVVERGRGGLEDVGLCDFDGSRMTARSPGVTCEAAKLTTSQIMDFTKREGMLLIHQAYHHTKYSSMNMD